MFHVIAPSQYRRTPWKNGGGLTEEIAAHPEGAALDGFDWRISIAAVDRDGPFSRFPGVDRTITLIEGRRHAAFGPDRDVVLDTLFEPYVFDGGDAVDCTLVRGAVSTSTRCSGARRARGRVTVVRRTQSSMPRISG
jgi:environmental stress-induced protein Ves